MTISATILGGIAGTKLTAEERDFFRDANPFGFILFGRNIEDPDQVRRLTSELRAALGRDALITIDQEGGRVQRLRGPHWQEWTPPLHDAKSGPRAIFLRYAMIGQELRDVGIDSNCAPCLDIARPETHAFLRDRCLGENVADVIRMGRAAANGLLSTGVLPVMKHLPGHGLATLDSHKSLPEVDADMIYLDALDFAPFRALNDLPLGMTAHIRYKDLDSAPATASPRIIEMIRTNIGFDGLLMSDDITMEALGGSHAERAAATIAAGCDIVLHCNHGPKEMAPVVAAAGAMSEAALRRAEAALSLRNPPDIQTMRAEYLQLLG